MLILKNHGFFNLFYIKGHTNMKIPNKRFKNIKEKPYLIIAIIFVTIFISISLYAGEWPPISVVESSSMEHSTYWTPGVINTGDMVFVKKVNSVNDIVTYIQGRETGYSTYGEYGNVILYKSPQGTIIIHRAIMYIKWINGKLVINNFSNQTWLKVCGDCVVINDIGFTHRNFSINVSKFSGQSGFITMGDNNLGSPYVEYNSKFNSYEAADQTIFNYPPVNLSAVVGVAFGQIPWIGLIKLNILGLEHKWPNSADVAKNSYLYLFLTLAFIFVAALLPYNKIIRKFKPLKK